MAETQVQRIDLSASTDLEADIKNQCEAMQALDLKLAGCFESQNQLILIFQD